MLFSLKQKTKKKDLKNFVGAFASKFNPLNLPNYQAGYLMNFTTDLVPGSIDPALASGQWFDAKILNNTSKLLQRGNSTVTGLVNGFKCQIVDVGAARLVNPTVDILNGIQNFTLLIGFKRPAATQSFHILISSQNAAPRTLQMYCGTANSNVFFVALTNDASANAIQCNTTLGNFNDDAWHVAVVTFNQTTKTVKLITELQTLTATNAAFVPDLFTPNDQFDFEIGTWQNTVPNTWNPGSVADVFLFNTVLADPVLDKLLKWEKTRLGL